MYSRRLTLVYVRECVFLNSVSNACIDDQTVEFDSLYDRLATMCPFLEVSFLPWSKERFISKYCIFLQKKRKREKEKHGEHTGAILLVKISYFSSCMWYYRLFTLGLDRSFDFQEYGD